MYSRRFSLVVLAASLAVLPACFEMKMHTKLEKDGSGTMDVHMGLTEGLVAVMAELKEADPDSDAFEDTKDIVLTEPDDETRRLMKEGGCEILEFQSESSEKRVFSRLKVAFENFQKLYQLENVAPEGEDDGDVPGQNASLVRNEDGTYTLSITKEGEDEDESGDEVFADENPFEEDEPEVEDDPPVERRDGEQGGGESDSGSTTDDTGGEEDFERAMELMGKMLAEAKNLKIEVGMEVPGEIVAYSPKTFAEVEGSKVVWTLGFESMMQMGGGDLDTGDHFSVTFRMPEGETIPASALKPKKAASTK